MISEARVTTDRPAVYIKRLCQHFQLKVPAEFNEERGLVEFAMGTCQMQVEPQTLVLQVQADDTAALGQVKDIVGNHLERFGHHDRLKVNWSDAEQAG